MNARTLLATAMVPFAVLALASPAAADHNSNNRASFSEGATGTAIANYSEGTGTFNAGTSVRGLAPGSYSYSVNGPAGVQEICTFEVSRNGNGSSNENMLELGGFTTAEIRDADGVIVTSDVFVRQGKSECRDPQQAGGQSAECPNRV